MSTVETAVQMLALCRKYALSGTDFAERFEPQTLAAVFNGIGPESWPQKLRDAVDNLAADLMPAAFIHDLRYAYGDGTTAHFSAANAELQANGYKIADALYSWWHPMRYITRRRARVFAELCEVFGWKPYIDACAANKNPAETQCEQKNCTQSPETPKEPENEGTNP